jgi:hypothetical protein
MLGGKWALGYNCHFLFKNRNNILQFKNNHYLCDNLIWFSTPPHDFADLLSKSKMKDEGMR